MPSKSHNYESNGPDVKVRGTAQQVLEKYLALARDANSAGDRIAAEGYFQFAEHYYRVMNAADQTNGRNNRNRSQQGEGGEAADQEASTPAQPGSPQPAAGQAPEPEAEEPEAATA